MLNFQATGEYEIRVVGGPRDGLLLNRSKNLITDFGLDQLVGNNASSYVYQQFLTSCHIGTGTTAPSPGDVALAARSAGTTTVQASVPASGNASSQTDATTRFYEVGRTFRFPVVTADVNYTEVGVGPDYNQLCSRALIVDAGGNPTSVTVKTGEQIDVTYKLRIVAPSMQVGSASSSVGTGTVVINSVTYNYTVYLHEFCDSTATINSNWPGLLARGDSDGNFRFAADANLTYPTGTWATSTIGLPTRTRISAGKRRVALTIPLNHATSGVGRVWLTGMAYQMASFVFVFDKLIPKDANSTLTFTIDYQITSA